MAAAAAAHRRGDLKQAEGHLRSALRRAEQPGFDKAALGETLQALALVLFEGQDFEGAEPLLERAVALAKGGPPEDEPRVAVLLNSLGLIRTRLGRNDAALSAYDRALALFTAHHGPQDERVGRVLANLAGLHMVEGRYPEAEAHYRKALPVLEAALGPRHLEVGRTLEAYAGLLRLMKRAPEAEALEDRAKAISLQEGSRGACRQSLLGWRARFDQTARMTESNGSSDTPGWDALYVALEGLYPGQEPKNYGPVFPYRIGGPDPLDGFSVYRVPDPVDHWHYITFGFSELYLKEWDDPEVSGFGFELTFRLECGSEDEPPAFACSLLQNLARYVFDSGNSFGAGHHLDLNGPIMEGADTAIDAICFAEDPKLPEIATPNGRLRFLQVVGITADELLALKAWNTDGFLETLKRNRPLLTTSLERASLLSDPKIADELAELARREGSSVDSLYVSEIKLAGGGLLGGQITWHVSAHQVAAITAVLPGRVCHDRPFWVLGSNGSVEFLLGPKPAVKRKGSDLKVTLTAELARRLAADLKPLRGDYVWSDLSGLLVTVEPSEIRDNEGKIVKTVG